MLSFLPRPAPELPAQPAHTHPVCFYIFNKPNGVMRPASVFTVKTRPASGPPPARLRTRRCSRPIFYGNPAGPPPDPPRARAMCRGHQAAGREASEVKPFVLLRRPANVLLCMLKRIARKRAAARTHAHTHARTHTQTHVFATKAPHKKNAFWEEVNYRDHCSHI